MAAARGGQAGPCLFLPHIWEMLSGEPARPLRVDVHVSTTYVCHSHKIGKPCLHHGAHTPKKQNCSLALSRRLLINVEVRRGQASHTRWRNGLPGPSARAARAAHHPVTKASRCAQEGVLRPPVLNHNKWSQGQLWRAVCAWPCGRKEKETTEKKQNPSKPTPERPRSLRKLQFA